VVDGGFNTVESVAYTLVYPRKYSGLWLNDEKDLGEYSSKSKVYQSKKRQKY